MTVGVAPEWIIDQRKRGWPDMHPEDYCHKCGAPNPSWCASREDWLTATSAWAAETGREGICCPACFQEMYEAATGRKVVMIITPWRGSWEAHEPTDPGPVVYDPPLTQAEGDAYWAAISDDPEPTEGKSDAVV